MWSWSVPSNDGLETPSSGMDTTISNDITTLPPDKTIEDIRDDTEATPSKLMIDLVIEEVSSFKFGMKDLLNVSKSSLDWEEPTTLKEKLLYIISKFIMLDRSPYNMPLDIKVNQQTDNTSSQPSKDDKKDLESEFYAMFGESEENSNKTIPNLMHPSDAIVILLNCCDTFVRQAIIQKMRTCQLAIPLILPDIINEKQMFLLWPMRHLHLNWKTKSMGSTQPKIIAKEGNPVNDGIPIISAIKLGIFSNSKSKILNNIICIHSHDIFFHKHCNGGQLSRKLSNGVIELAWYLPGGKDKDIFEDCWTLANLRGDARNHEKQLHLLKQVSPIMLVFISLESISDSNVQSILQQLSNSKQHLIFVFLDPVSPVSSEEKKQNQSVFIKMFSTLMQEQKCSFVAESGAGKEKNETTLKTAIRDKIKQALQSLRNGSKRTHLNLEDVSRHANAIGISVDENNEFCQKGKDLANEIMDKLLLTEAEVRKKNILPLQGKFNSWSEYCKQLNRMEDIDSTKMYKKMQQCRKEQFNMVQNMTPVMKGFIEIVTKSENIQAKMYFLQWLKLFLDAQSQHYLPDQEKKYHALWNNMKNKKEADTKELDKLASTLDDLSFGLEHILREIGQVYEAIVDSERNAEFKGLEDNLPTFAADLLIGGYPIEILDGDASHLPLKWIKAVFEKVKYILGDKRVYVISVLGIQSSGKSTLLNTMFGLNFSVSAGRCTKGVFAQLITVDRDLHSKLGYEYILVLDTEGLRAMELGNIKLKHDNELASFIIGMGAVTIVNNKGENTAEIGDVLQICVHAFLRMRLANNNMNLQPGCYFAHQNVPDVNAESKMLYGFKKLKDQLDEIATAAAKHENVVSKVNSFSDKIQFDVNKQIWYFPNLWIGDPPMAPANPGYSEKVLKLKTDILEYPSKDSSLTLTKLQERLSDLWKAILNENFVFSFKNSQEVRCYSLLEEKILAVSREFHNKVKIEVHKYTNRIKSCEKDFSNLKENLLAELTNYIRKCQVSYKEELDAYFSASADKEIIIQWKNFAACKLEEIVLALRNDEISNIRNIVELRKAKFENIKEIGNYKDDIEKFVRKILATGISSETSKDVLERKFEEKWEEFINGLHFPPIKEKKNIEEEVNKFFRDQYNRHMAKLESRHYTENVKIEDSDIDMTGLFDRVGDKVFKLYAKERRAIKNEIEIFSQKVVQTVKDYLNDIENMDYETHFLFKIKEKFDTQINSFNSKQDRYKLSKKFEVKMISHVLQSTIPHFERMQTEYRKENDQKNMINKMYKKNTYEIFIGTYTQCNKEITAAKIWGDSLESAILDSLNREISEVISNKLMVDKIEFHSKIKLISKILKDLKSKGDYRDYDCYITNIERSLETWIKEYVKNYCLEKQNKLISMLGVEANKLFKLKIEMIMNCIENVPLDSTTNFNTWISEFNKAVKGNGSIPLADIFLNLFNMKEVEVKSVEYFRDEITKYLRYIQKRQENILNTWGLNQLQNLKPNPHKIIIKTILGCMEQCPFCKVICSCTFTHSTDEVKHSARHHYPGGIAGNTSSLSNELTIDSCNEKVASDKTYQSEATNDQYVKYKDYRSINSYHNSWDIQPDKSMESLAYWKWVFGKFSKNFAEDYGANDDRVPSEWKQLSSNIVEASIEII